MKKLFWEVAVIAALVLISLLAWTQATPSQGAGIRAVDPRPYTIEYYYKVRWGSADEFIRLFKKNHYPLLRKQIEMGRLVSVTAVQPRYHGTEDGRWDYRVTIVFRNAAAHNEDFDEQALARQLFPDQDTYKREEQRRFEILLAHWDLPIKTVDLEK